jgi:hypothetical protein
VPALAAAALAASPADPAWAAAPPPPPVAVYPSPGTSYNLRGTQITFRGVPAGQIGQLTVAGSRSGAHTGKIEADSDGQGGSFLPDKDFAGGEKVTVTTGLNVVGGTAGKFSFTIEHASRTIEPTALPLVPAGSNGLQHFRSRPDLLPPSIAVSSNSAPASEGDIFLAPQFGPSQNGPMILDPRGRLVWFQPYPVARNTLITDFRVQSLKGQPVLTWWQGFTNHGTGEGQGVIFDANYRRIAVVNAGNGLQMDLHEFLITPQGQAYVIAVSPVSLPSVPHKPVYDSVVQEIDLQTGLVLFEWHALDHVALGDSQFTPNSPGQVFDPYHANSAAVDRDGNLIVSLRDTSAVYKINRSTGNVIWTLGGKRSSFKMGSGTTTAFQHNAIVQPDGTLTIFDDGAGPPTVHNYSRGIRVALDTRRMTATLIKEYDHSPQTSSAFEGGIEDLGNGDVFLGWGQQPYFSEFNGSGQQIFDAHFVAPTGSYRAYRFQWSAQPPTTPALAVSPASSGTSELYASWNGATDVAAWRVLAGSTSGSLTPVGRTAASGFETAIAAGSEAPYLAVQPLGSSGNVLATSTTVAAPAHVAIYGTSAFVPPASGLGGLPVGCFTGHPCSLTTTITSGRTVLAHTGPEGLTSGAGGIVYFRLSPAARTALARARGGRLPAQVTVQDSSGARAAISLTLVAFQTGGAGPHRSLSQSSPLQIVGATDFVNSAGTGGILAGCQAPVSACQVTSTVSAGRTVIARTGREYLNAGDLGYLLFSLTPSGRSMLAHAPGNQLAAQVRITDGAVTATGQIALVGFR